jgi:hypothetical protein
VLAGALLAAGAAVAASAAGVGWVEHDPVFRAGLGVGELALVAAVLAAGVLPFAGTRARLGITRV